MMDAIAHQLEQAPPEQIAHFRDMGALYPSLVTLYENRAYQPFWLDQNSKLNAQGSALLARLADAESDGLIAEHYLLDRLNELAIGDSENNPVALELLLTLSTMQFVDDLRNGRVTPGDLQLGLPVMHSPADFPTFFSEIEQGKSPDEAIYEQAPPINIYHQLQKLLSKWLPMSKEGELTPAVLPKTLHPGDPLPTEFALALSQRMALIGAIPPPESDIYEGDWIEAVESIQRLHGLHPDGLVGKRTLAAMNKSWKARIDKLITSLERTRWLPRHTPEQRYIIVNVPEFKLRAFDGPLENPEMIMNVVVGKTYTRYRTPIFRENMTYVVFTPYWNIPNSILRRSILPNVDGPDYLAAHHYEMVEFFSKTAPTVAATAENIERLKKGELLLRQTPGAHNALGQAKFIFPNANNVYLHGTPAQSLFGKEVRAFSAGCIRVEDVPALAEWVFKQQGWDRSKVDAVLAEAKPKQVNLEQPIIVAILYLTAVVDSNEELFLFEDIYGHDKRLLEKLSQL
ncbi:L,D-transpeptidase family protein [Corallincola platygyrae]